MNEHERGSRPAEASFAVVVPTRNRPDKLAGCLDAIHAAVAGDAPPIYVCDSSTDPDLRERVRAVCSRHLGVTLVHHTGTNVAAARNACAEAASEELLVNVDDDIRVERGSIHALVHRYQKTAGPRVVGGSVAWDGVWSQPVKMRLIGYGRYVRDDEEPDFLIGAFFLYPRAYALTWPWNERMRTSDDRFMGALWRSKGVRLLFEPSARAIHDPQRVLYHASDQRCHIYANLFDSVIANPNLLRALAYEVLGFSAGLKTFGRSARPLGAYVRAWYEGNRDFVRDIPALRTLVRRSLGAAEGVGVTGAVGVAR